ncbi:MAG: hypothetical protein GWN79_27465, partial [Actinobacteria bacterium]|nr:hypothetical protein [Actinomycetota bacterium]NIS36784.1 hypothetical protein [Actinomycetota bacterium]NIU22548.1 hypothetical protein [Actinomycetota bacterium]NIU71273.1 hypothetical protein [Actinomycetota bacterium]NIW33225.1 hypothetical protein [Actinomycetota bacterium]
VPGTLYEVRLYFAEIFNGIGGAGERVFDVAVDGVLVLDDFDILDEVGSDVGTRRSVLVQATGATLPVDFFHEVENPKVSAIEIFASFPGGSGNTPPTLAAPGDQTHEVGAPVSLGLVASDPDPDALTYDATNLPAGLSLDSGTGVISGIPTRAESQTVTVSVDDGTNPAVAQGFTWTITEPGSMPPNSGNTPPQLANPGAQSHPAGVALSLALAAVDPDPDLLTFSASGLPAGLSVDAMSGVISGAPTTAGSGTVTVQVEDGVHPPAQATFTWTIFDPGGSTLVHRVNAGGPTLPGADGLGDWIADSAFANTGNAFQTGELVIHDATVPALVPAGLFQSERWDPATAPALNFSFPVVAGGTYEVRLYFAEIFNGIGAPGQRLFDVSIDGALVLESFDIVGEVGPDVGTMRSAVVTAATDALVVAFGHVVQNPKVSGIEVWALGTNLPPTLSDPGDQSHEVGESVSLALAASDPEMDPLLFGASNLPEGLAIDPASGVISGQPTSTEVRSVTVSVDDGNHPPVTRTFLWTIEAGSNPPPVLTNPGDQTTDVGASVSLQILATDT